MGMLAVNVNELLAGLAKLIDSCGMAVDERARSPVPIDHPAQQQPILITLEGLLTQPIRELGQRFDAKFGDDVRALGPGAHLLASGPLAECQRQRVDQDGFSGTRLAGQRGETGMKLELQSIDNREVMNGEMQQHGWWRLETFAPVELLTQHRVIAVPGRVNEHGGVLGAPEHNTVPFLKIALQLTVEVKPCID